MAVVRQISLDVRPHVLPFSPEARRLAHFAPGGTIAIIDLDDPGRETSYHAMAGVNSLRFIDRGETLVAVFPTKIFRKPCRD